MIAKLCKPAHALKGSRLAPLLANLLLHLDLVVEARLHVFGRFLKQRLGIRVLVREHGLHGVGHGRIVILRVELRFRPAVQQIIGLVIVSVNVVVFG